MKNYSQQLLSRMQANGGFQFSSKGPSRPDATAWAIFILANSGIPPQTLEHSRDYLVASQHEDGRVCLDANHPEAFWPTPLALLAWQASPAHSSHYQKAIEFLLNSSGEHWAKQNKSPVKHDTSLRGWPWIDQTHSWVESTSMTMIALHLAGKGNHPRLRESTELLLDRQLPHGGWNYGNTEVFGQELRPSPEDTGAALSALAGRIKETHVKLSLRYLVNRIQTIRSPISMGWSLLGLNAWDHTPNNASILIEETLSRHTRFGEYDTPSLCLALSPRIAPQGLKNLAVGTGPLPDSDEAIS